VDEPWRERAESLLERRDARGGERGGADPVVRGLAGDDDVAVGPALGVPRETDELDCRLDTLGAAIREEDVIEPGG